MAADIERTLQSVLNYKDQIQTHAKQNGFNPTIIAAIIATESRGNTFACRVENNFERRYMRGKTIQQLGGHIPPPKDCSGETEYSLRKHSFGLMQIMGQTAREIGFKGLLLELCIPETCLTYGCFYLSKLFAQKKGMRQAIFAYNHGPGTVYRENDDYEVKVFNWQRQFIEHI